jgi:hypothetical protein
MLIVLNDGVMQFFKSKDYVEPDYEIDFERDASKVLSEYFVYVVFIAIWS